MNQLMARNSGGGEPSKDAPKLEKDAKKGSDSASLADLLAGPPGSAAGTPAPAEGKRRFKNLLRGKQSKDDDGKHDRAISTSKIWEKMTSVLSPVITEMKNSPSSSAIASLSTQGNGQDASSSMEPDEKHKQQKSEENMLSSGISRSNPALVSAAPPGHPSISTVIAGADLEPERGSAVDCFFALA
jgi:hypothetical protein